MCKPLDCKFIKPPIESIFFHTIDRLDDYMYVKEVVYHQTNDNSAAPFSSTEHLSVFELIVFLLQSQCQGFHEHSFLTMVGDSLKLV